MQIKRNKILLICIGLLILICLIRFLIYSYNDYGRTGSISHLAKEIKRNPLYIFNTQFIEYRDRQKGIEICNLINTIISSNSRYDEKDNPIVSLKYESWDTENEDIYIVPNKNESKEEEFLELLELIDKEQYYYVDVEQNDNHFINKVKIYEMYNE
ncbi:MAG: hypothetical protein K1W33_06520 [Clostridia bacterium]